MMQKINGKNYENIDRYDVRQDQQQSQIKGLKAIPFIKDKNNQAKKQSIQIIESMQIREQNIKQGLGNTGTSNQGNDIELKIFSILQALDNEISEQGERQGSQGPHDKFLFRKEKNS